MQRVRGTVGVPFWHCESQRVKYRWNAELSDVKLKSRNNKNAWHTNTG